MRFGAAVCRIIKILGYLFDENKEFLDFTFSAKAKLDKINAPIKPDSIYFVSGIKTIINEARLEDCEV